MDLFQETIKQMVSSGVRQYVVKIDTFTVEQGVQSFYRVYKGLCVDDATDAARIEFPIRNPQHITINFLDQMSFNEAIVLTMGKEFIDRNDITDLMEELGYFMIPEDMVFIWRPEYTVFQNLPGEAAQL